METVQHRFLTHEDIEQFRSPQEEPKPEVKPETMPLTNHRQQIAKGVALRASKHWERWDYNPTATGELDQLPVTHPVDLATIQMLMRTQHHD